MPGAALLDAVAVMDRLRSPGGCPWDAEQTHASLLQYLVEECYELYDAVEQGDRAAMREELGDVLLQVLFHARVAAEAEDGFTIDDVARDLVAKLVGRHPHVFAGTERVDTAQRQEQRWEELKRAEKQRDVQCGRGRARPARGRVGGQADQPHRPRGPAAGAAAVAGRGWGSSCSRSPPRPSSRASTRRPSCAPPPCAFADDVRAAEQAAAAEGADPHALDPEAWKRHWPDATRPRNRSPAAPCPQHSR